MTEPLETDALKATDEKMQNVVVVPVQAVQTDNIIIVPANNTQQNDDNTTVIVYQAGAPTTGLTSLDKLSFLDDLYDLYIEQPFRAHEFWIESCCNWEIRNEYRAFSANRMSKTLSPLFILEEESECCSRQCCGNSRPFVLKATVNDKLTEIFTLRRPYRCGWCCCSPLICCGRQYMEVLIGNKVIGSIREMYVCCNCKINYGIYDANGNEICELKTFFVVCDMIQTGFDIYINGKDTGKKITKLFGGILKELFTSNDNYVVEFPDQLKNSREAKLLLIGASMLLEYKYFENKQKNEKNVNSKWS